MYKPDIPANYFLKKSIDSDKSVTAIKLELMIYFAHAWHLAILGTSLINEAVLAWRHGPVIESIHLRYNKRGVNLFANLDAGTSNKLKKSDKYFLDQIWTHYCRMSEQEMISQCHKPNTPWESTYKKSSSKIVIDNLLIKKYYRRLIATDPNFADLEDDSITEYSDVG
ncbi:MAG: DUF4065 domain-containing protein [Cyclobacteriaceae bacterium]